MAIIPITIDANADWNAIDITSDAVWVRAAGSAQRFSCMGSNAGFVVTDKHVQLTQTQFASMPLHAEIAVMTDSSLLEVRTAHGSSGTLRISSPVDSAYNPLSGTAENALNLTIQLTAAGAARKREDDERSWASAQLPAVTRRT